MPKGIFKRPPPRGLLRKAAGMPDVHIPLALEEACRNFESEVGGREALIAHLAHAQLNADQELLVGAIADPRNDRASLARICHVFGIQFSDLLALFRNAGFVKAQLAAMQRVWGRLPDVAGDVMERSVPHQVRCARCAGTGKTERTVVDGCDANGKPRVARYEEVCDVCNGECWVLVQPRLETQKVALELGGLLQQGAGVQVNVTQQQAQSGGGGNLSGFWARADATIHPPVEEAPAIDAEVVVSEDETYADAPGESSEEAFVEEDT